MAQVDDIAPLVERLRNASEWSIGEARAVMDSAADALERLARERDEWRDQHGRREREKSCAVDAANELRARVAELEREREIWCDKPEDRLYHAEDRTWWKRAADGRCVAADPPPEVAAAEPKARALDALEEWLRPMPGRNLIVFQRNGRIYCNLYGNSAGANETQADGPDLAAAVEAALKSADNT